MIIVVLGIFCENKETSGVKKFKVKDQLEIHIPKSRNK